MLEKCFGVFQIGGKMRVKKVGKNGMGVGSTMATMPLSERGKKTCQVEDMAP